MNNLNEKVSYLKGLMEGMDIDTNANEGKLFAKIVETLEDLAREVDYINEDLDDMEEYLDAMDDDLTDLEDDFYDLEDEEDEDEFYEIECPSCDDIFYLDESDLIFDGEGLIKVACPNCGEMVVINEEMDYFAENEEDETEDTEV
ncbi:MAG TPA: MJ0042-type zinc finger domain-containing protein [Clostridia bacterium]|nr:MJ0042-type zinc finger domain-containing protein [Clostridia bacterium]